MQQLGCLAGPYRFDAWLPAVVANCIGVSSPLPRIPWHHPQNGRVPVLRPLLVLTSRSAFSTRNHNPHSSCCHRGCTPCIYLCLNIYAQRTDCHCKQDTAPSCQYLLAFHVHLEQLSAHRLAGRLPAGGPGRPYGSNNACVHPLYCDDCLKRTSYDDLIALGVFPQNSRTTDTTPCRGSRPTTGTPPQAGPANSEDSSQNQNIGYLSC